MVLSEATLEDIICNYPQIEKYALDNDQTLDTFINVLIYHGMESIKRTAPLQPGEKSSIRRGQEGERYVTDILADEFPHVIIEDTSKSAQSCDIKAKIGRESFMIEVKHYTGTVPQKEVTKFERDMAAVNKKNNVNYGIFISLNQKIANKKGRFIIETRDWGTAVYISTAGENDIRAALISVHTLISQSAGNKSAPDNDAIMKATAGAMAKTAKLQEATKQFGALWSKFNDDILEKCNTDLALLKLINNDD